MIYQDINSKICLTLFGWKENILPKEHIVQCTIFWLAFDQTNELGGGEARSLDKEVGREELDRQERQSWKRWKIFPHTQTKYYCEPTIQGC